VTRHDLYSVFHGIGHPGNLLGAKINKMRFRQQTDDELSASDDDNSSYSEAAVPSVDLGNHVEPEEKAADDHEVDDQDDPDAWTEHFWFKRNIGDNLVEWLIESQKVSSRDQATSLVFSAHARIKEAYLEDTKTGKYCVASFSVSGRNGHHFVTFDKGGRDNWFIWIVQIGFSYAPTLYH